MLKKLVMLVMLMCAVAVSGATVDAQAKAPAPAASKPSPAKPDPAAKPAPAEVALPVNIRIEVNITDQTGSNPGAKKVVTMIVADRQSNSIRSSASVPVKNSASPTPSYRNVTINVDARPSIIQKDPNKIMVSFGLEYSPKSRSEPEEMEPGMASINERLGLILESGKPLIVSQAADPTSDRKITVEVTATILR
jgi:hypothetical protein